MRKLSTEKRALILSALAEGNSVASIVRMFKVNKRTVLRLMVDAGAYAQILHDDLVRNLKCDRVQMDEIWSFVHSKDRSVSPGKEWEGHGSQWTWTSLCADSKLVINWMVGGRDADYGRAFVEDLASRLSNRVQLTSDGWQVYRDAVERAFGGNVDYAMLVKNYAADRTGQTTRYSPPAFVCATKNPQTGYPDPAHISTSYVERHNLTIRMTNRRFTRLTNAHSKTLHNHEAAIALNMFAYNFIRKNQAIKTTPAVAADVASKEWTWVEFVQRLEREERKAGGRITDYQPAASKKQAS